MILFTDTSHHKGILDFSYFKKLNIFFNIHKATEGISFVDSTFDNPSGYSSVNNMELNDMIWGSYHYYRWQFNPTQQAIHYYNIAHRTPIPPIIDVEKINNYGTNRDNFTSILKVLLDVVGELFKRTPIIYTGYYAWTEFTTRPLWAKKHKLWLARYRETITPDLIPPPWTMEDLLMWQYTDRLTVPPYYPIDGDRFFGTIDDIYLLANRTPPSTVEERLTSLENRVAILEERCPQT